MMLTAEELQFINKRMDKFHILYQEIYDELTDHVISAIEDARDNGDERDIIVVFDEVILTHFGDSGGIKQLQLKNVRAYNGKMMKVLVANLKYYLNWQACLTILIVIITGFYLPHTKNTDAVLWFGLIITAFFPSAYVLIRSKHIKTTIKRQSLVKSFVQSIAQFLSIFIYLLPIGFRFLSQHFGLSFLNPLNYPPVIYVVLLAVFIIYGLSAMRLCRQAFKLSV